MGDGVSGRVRHVILARIAQGAGDAQVGAIAAELAGLVGKIEGIESFEFGANNSPEGRNRGFTHALMFTFLSREARDAYLLHPEHANAATRIVESGMLEDLLVVDYSPLEVSPEESAQDESNKRDGKGDNMPAQENKEFIRQYLTALSGQEKTRVLVDKYISDSDSVLKQHIAYADSAFPRYAMDIEDMVAEGDKVAVRFTLRGVHRGEFMGMPATGKQVEVPGLIIYRVVDNKIVEHWIQTDDATMMKQLSA